MWESKTINRTLFIIFFSLTCQLAQSQIRFYAEVSEGPLLPMHSFQIQYIAEGANSLEGFEWKDMKGLLLLDSFTHYNKSIDRNGEPTPPGIIKVLVVMASESGRFMVPQARALVNGRWMQSQSFPLNIGDQQSKKSAQITVPIEQFSVVYANEETDRKIRENIFIRIEASKDNCFVGEGITVTYKFYSRMDARSQVLKRPSFNGCSVLDMEENYDSTAHVEFYNGAAYFVNVLRKIHLFALQPGTLPLDFAEVMSTVTLRRSKDKQFNGGTINHTPSPESLDASVFQRTLSIRSVPFFIKVKEPPVMHKPDGFTGAMGSFKITLSTEEKKILPRSLVKIHVRLLGSGNFPLLLQPVIQWPKGLNPVNSISKEVLNLTKFPLTGYKEFEFTFTVPDAGRFYFPPVSFCYFNPDKIRYETIYSEGLNLEVITGGREVPVSKGSVSNEGFPLHYYWFLAVIGAVLFVLFYQIKAAGKERRDFALKAVEPIRQAVSKDYLEDVRVSYYTEATEHFSSEMLKAIWMFFEEEWQIDPGTHTREILQVQLSEKQIPLALQEQLLAFISTCEWNAYTGTPIEMERCRTLLNEAELLLSSLRSSLRIFVASTPY